MQQQLKQPTINYSQLFKIQPLSYHISKQVLVQSYLIEIQYQKSPILPRISTYLIFKSQPLYQQYYQKILLNVHNKSSYIQQYDNLVTFQHDKIKQSNRYCFNVISEPYRWSLADMLMIQQSIEFPISFKLLVLRNLLQGYKHIIYLLEKYPKVKLHYTVSLNTIFITREYNIVLGLPQIPINAVKDQQQMIIPNNNISTQYRVMIRQCMKKLQKQDNTSLQFFLKYNQYQLTVNLANEKKNINEWLEVIYGMIPWLKNHLHNQQSYQFCNKYCQLINTPLNKKMIQVDEKINAHLLNIINQSRISGQQQQHNHRQQQIINGQQPVGELSDDQTVDYATRISNQLFN